MAGIYRLWAERSDSRLTDAVMACLSVFGYGALPSDPKQATAKIAMFKMVLEDEPIWAVEQAVKWWAKTHREAPSPKELLDRAKKEKGFFDTYKGECVGRIYEKMTKWIRESK